MHYFDWIIILLYIGILAFIIFKSRQHSQTMSDFAIDRQRTPGILVFATLSASFIGPGYTLGIAEQGFKSCLLFFYIYLGFSIQTIIVGKFIAPRLRNYQGAFTVGDIMGYHYGKLARVFTGLISLLYCAGIVGVVAQVSGNILNGAIHIPFIWGVIGSTIIVIIYSSLGGMRTVLFTDIFQFIMLAFAMSVLLICIFLKTPSIENVIHNLPPNFSSPVNGITIYQFFGLFLAFLLGETLVPPYTNRAFVSKDQKSAQSGFIASGIFSVFWFAMVITIGITARALYPEIQAKTSFMYMVSTYLPIGLFGMMMVAIISIIMSTQDSYLNSASVSFVRDILEAFNKKVTDKKALFYSRIATIIIGLLGIIFALNATGIIEALLLNYTFWAPTVVLPLIIGVLLKGRVKPLSGLVAMFTGGVAVAVWEWGLKTPFEIPSLLVAIIANQIGFWLTHIFSNTDSSCSWLKSSSGCTNKL